ncbi:hypothetical protein [Dyella acidiphila]|uniref:Secreted protein n=1 Tax=Dyella acidiphila TaxID=2775866 RepID=A0ABR9GG32_9GAMM|nr:hypothetical protein [Dyella acidiphila]MBE1163007.1 hypothetical protein [Dyella acidiphila]
MKNLRATLLMSILVLAGAAAQAAEHTPPPFDAKIDVPPESFMNMFGAKGSPDRPRAYLPNAAERQQIAHAVSLMPPLQQRALREHLFALSFADGMPNNALTYPSPGHPGMLNITLRAGLLHETVSQLITHKEAACFAGTNASDHVAVDVGQLPAVIYILLHESTHVADSAYHLTPKDVGKGVQPTPFSDGLWLDRNHLADAYAKPALQVACYHPHGYAATIAQAQAVYQALSATPLPSLYASAAAPEDLAETVAFANLTQVFHQTYVIRVYHAGREVYAYRPMDNALVQAQVRRLPEGAMAAQQ